jgi:methyl-accepting chemotaxis protein
MKLRTRFTFLFIVLIIIFLSIALFTSFSLLKINKFTEIDKKVYQLYNLSLELKKNEGDYFNWDLKNPDYFKTGKSEHYTLFHKNYQVSDGIYNQLVGSGFIKRNHFNEKIKGIKQLLYDYQNLFSIIEKNKLDLGFEEWGLLGQMNTSVSNVEIEIEKQNDLKLKIQLLTLRQHEKDYLFRKNFQYKELFDRELFSILENLKSKSLDKSKSEKIHNSLKLYANNFNNLVEKDFYIGLSKDEGLMNSLEKNGDILNEAITSLSQSISRKTNQYIALTTFILLVFIAICTFIALFIGSLISKKILKLMGGEPEEVVSITKNISKGDLRFHLGESSKYHGLMKSIVIMTEKLKGIISGIYYNSYQIASASNQFSNTSHKISMGAISQSSFIEDISSKIEIIKMKTSSNSEMASETDKIALLTMESMHKIKDQSDLTLLTSNEIAEKVQIIDQITFQTKILALNAAVEAAQAGNYGNGFQVIAEEIKRLAEVSKDAAIEIKNLTEKNQIQSEKVRNMVFEILIAIENTSDLIKNIAQSSKEQDSNIDQISSSINHLQEVSQNNTIASEEMAAGTEELEKQVIALKEMVSYFKVDKEVEKGQSYNLLNHVKEKAKKDKKKVMSLFKKIKLKENKK